MSIALVIAVTYFVVLSVGVSLWTRKRVTSGNDFVTGGGKLPWILVAAAFSIAPLGAGHTLSLWQRSAEMGVSVLWWGIMAGGVFVPMFILWFGPWFRRLKVQTFPEGMGKIFGERIGYVISAVFPAQLLGICIAEILATATAFYALSGGSQGPLDFRHCIILAIILTIAYVFVGGLMQVAWMNLFNAIVLIGGSFIAVFYTGGWLKRKHPEIGWEGGGWESVAAHYTEAGEAFKLTLLNFTPEVIFLLMIPCLFLTVFMCSASQVQNQPMLLARNESDIRRGVFWCSLVNSMSTYPWVIIALVALSFPVIAALPGAASLSVPEFALMAFPPWLVGILMTALLAATLSTTAQLILASSHIVVNDIFKRACNPSMSDRTFFILTRSMIIIFALVVIIPALREPKLMSLLYWVFSFAIPVFGVYLIGMLWKVNKIAAWVTLLAGYLASFLWTFLLQWNWPSWLPGYFNQNVYPTIAATLFFGIVMNLILPGKPGYLRQMKEAEKNDTTV